MARIILGSYAMQFPMGGYLSWVTQWLVGMQRLGHDVYFIERSTIPDSCYNPVSNIMSNDCSYGMTALNALLRRFGIVDHSCFVDYTGQHHGITAAAAKNLFESADLFIDMGTHGAFRNESEKTRLRVLVDGEPGKTQMNMEIQMASGRELPEYDYYYTVGQNIGTSDCTSPTAGKDWKPVFFPAILDLFQNEERQTGAPFSTIMSWQAHDVLTYDGVSYGQKDIEFEKFMDLPNLTAAPMEIAVAGRNVPEKQLNNAGWRIRDAHTVSTTFDSFIEYIRKSSGEFSVCKNIFVATNSGWFGDRAAAYLASHRPVVMQDTGFSTHLPCGEGLFAVRNVEEASEAIDTIISDHARHANAAREIAVEHLDATRVLGRFFSEIGL